MIIEFLGISGVGKSTIAEEFYAEEQKKGNNVVWPRYALYMKHGWLVRNLLKIKGVIQAATCNRGLFRNICKLLDELGIAGKDKAVLVFNFLSYKNLFSKCQDPSVDYVFDEGVCQLIWAVFLRTDREICDDYVKRIISFFQVPNKLIIVDAETDTIISRLESRGRKTKILESSALSEKINRMRWKQTEIVKSCILLKLLLDSQIVYVDNDEEKDDRK